MGILQIFAVEIALSRRRIPREGHARRTVVTHISEDHGLDIDRRPPIIRDIVQAAIRDCSRILPRAEHGTYCTPKLYLGILRERRLSRLLHDFEIVTHDCAQVRAREIRVVLYSASFFSDI